MMDSRNDAGPVGDRGELAAGIAEALEVELGKIGPIGLWYDWHRDWLETMAKVAHLWGAPDVDSWNSDARTDREVWNRATRHQLTIWTVDAAAVIGERSLSFVQAARSYLDPIAAAEAAGVRPRLTPLWYSHEMPYAYRYFFPGVEEFTMPQAFQKLSHNGWDPQMLTPTERFGWEMIPVWVWREAAEFAAKWDDMSETLKVAEPPWSDPLVLEVSEWWARRRTEAFEAELEEMARSFGHNLEQLGVELTARAARCGLGPAVLERTAFTVRREGMDQEDVYDILTECAHGMQTALATDTATSSQRSHEAPPEQLILTDYDSGSSALVLLSEDAQDHSVEPLGCSCQLSGAAMERDAVLARERLRTLTNSDPRRGAETPSSPARCSSPTNAISGGLMGLHAELTAAVVVNRARRAAEGHEALRIELAVEKWLGMTADHEQIAAAMMLAVAAEALSAAEVLELLELALSYDRCCDVVADLRSDLARHWDYWPWLS